MLSLDIFSGSRRIRKMKPFIALANRVVECQASKFIVGTEKKKSVGFPAVAQIPCCQWGLDIMYKVG